MIRTTLLALAMGWIPALVGADVSGSFTDTEEYDRQLDILSEDLNVKEFPEESDLFDIRLSEVKTLFADAIIADTSGDTLEAVYLFDLVFDALSELIQILWVLVMGSKKSGVSGI